MKFQRVPLKFHTKYIIHTLNIANLIQCWKFESIIFKISWSFFKHPLRSCLHSWIIACFMTSSKFHPLSIDNSSTPTQWRESVREVNIFEINVSKLSWLVYQFNLIDWETYKGMLLSCCSITIWITGKLDRCLFCRSMINRLKTSKWSHFVNNGVVLFKISVLLHDTSMKLVHLSNLFWSTTR